MHELLRGEEAYTRGLACVNEKTGGRRGGVLVDGSAAVIVIVRRVRVLSFKIRDRKIRVDAPVPETKGGKERVYKRDRHGRERGIGEREGERDGKEGEGEAARAREEGTRRSNMADDAMQAEKNKI